MTNPHHQHLKLTVSNLVDDAIVTHVDPVEALWPREFLHARRPRIGDEAEHDAVHTSEHVPRQ